jgi:hypothetical protein
MNQATIFQKILSQEFSCYYIEDGFEVGWENSIAELAFDSAIRLHRCLSHDSIQEFSMFLETLKNEPSHPFIETLSDETLIDWNSSPSTWKLLQKILGLIKDNLKKIEQTALVNLENGINQNVGKVV